MARKAPIGDAVVKYGTQFLGRPYVWGGTSPSGFDCSGFVTYVYKKYGITFPRTSMAQWAYFQKQGKAVPTATATSPKGLKPGDLVFYRNSSGQGDVKMYAGNGMVIGASGGRRTGGRVKKLPYGYRKDFIGAARVSGKVVSSEVEELTQKVVKSPAQDPNALGTNTLLRKQMARNMILSGIRRPQEQPFEMDFINEGVS